MECSARIFNCASCHRQVIICSYCDRGNIYCTECSLPSRQESVRAAGKRYQNTYRGRLNHSKRQKLYMERKRKKMTYHPCQEVDHDDLLKSKPKKIINEASSDKPCCHFCGCRCGSSLRTTFLDRNRMYFSGAWPLGP